MAKPIQASKPTIEQRVEAIEKRTATWTRISAFGTLLSLAVGTGGLLTCCKWLDTRVDERVASKTEQLSKLRAASEGLRDESVQSIRASLEAIRTRMGAPVGDKDQPLEAIIAGLKKDLDALLARPGSDPKLVQALQEELKRQENALNEKNEAHSRRLDQIEKKLDDLVKQSTLVVAETRSMIANAAHAGSEAQESLRRVVEIQLDLANSTKNLREGLAVLYLEQAKRRPSIDLMEGTGTLSWWSQRAFQLDPRLTKAWIDKDAELKAKLPRDFLIKVERAIIDPEPPPRD